MSTLAQAEPMVVPAEPAAPGWVPSPLYRMSVERYEAMVAAGVFDKRDRFHLINGYLVAKMTHNPPHASSCEATRLAIEALLPAGWHVRSDKPLLIPSHTSVPEPDEAVVRGIWRDYTRRHPQPAEVALLVEVADSSLAQDRRMAEIYGGAGIPVYWIVNLVNRQVEVYTDPIPGGYATRTIFAPGQTIPVLIDGRPLGQVAVDDILP